jgi:hypothetical protein
MGRMRCQDVMLLPARPAFGKVGSTGINKGSVWQKTPSFVRAVPPFKQHIVLQKIKQVRKACRCDEHFVWPRIHQLSFPGRQILQSQMSMGIWYQMLLLT